MVSAVIGSIGVRVARSTSDFLVASRTVGPVANASAISGEYLSAASFLGVAGMILRDGADALWFPIAFTTGYLALVLFVAAPLRRSGAYTVPDFAVARLNSEGLRRLCTVFVLIIGWLYLLPQLQGAGLALTTLTALPAWSGIAGAGLVVVLTVIGGGMRSITFVQAFQFWLKLTALVVPAVFVLGLFLSDSRSLDRHSAPDFRAATTVDVRTDVVLQTPEPLNVVVDGTVDGVRSSGPVTWAPGRHEVAAGTQLQFPAGSPVPTVAGAPTTDGDWLQPGSGDATNQMLADLLPADRRCAGHDGPAARARPLLHEPGRPGGPAHDRGGAGPDRRVLHRGRAARGARPALHAGPAVHRRHRRRGAPGAHGRARGGLDGLDCSAGSWRPGPRRRSCRRRPDWS